MGDPGVRGRPRPGADGKTFRSPSTGCKHPIFGESFVGGDGGGPSSPRELTGGLSPSASFVTASSVSGESTMLAFFFFFSFPGLFNFCNKTQAQLHFPYQC